MAKYEVSKSGAEALHSLAANIRLALMQVDQAANELRVRINDRMDDLGEFGNDIWNNANSACMIMNEHKESLEELANMADHQSDMILSLLDFDSGSAADSGASGQSGGSIRNIAGIQRWISLINPTYRDAHTPYIGAGRSDPYEVNCGSCALAVEHRLNGDVFAHSVDRNIGYDFQMEQITGKKCTYMGPENIEGILRGMGAGSHLICGITRVNPLNGRPATGHWFNAYFDGENVYTLDGQNGHIYEWPHDYGNVDSWCAMI